MSRRRRPRSRTTTPFTLPAISTPASRDDRNTETRECASAASARDRPRAARSRRRSRPGKPTMMSDPIDAFGIRVADVVHQRRRSTRSCKAGASPPARGCWRAAAAGGNAARSGRTAATRSTISREQSIGSSEEMRKRTRSAKAFALPAPARAAARSATTRGSRSRPYEPRWTPVSAISLNPAAVTRSTSRRISSTATLRGVPLVVGMMQ